MPRRRSSASDDFSGCFGPLLVLFIGAAALGLALQLLAAGIMFVREEWPLVVAAIAIAVLALLALRRAWRGARRRRPLLVDELAILNLSTYGFEAFCRDVLEREGYDAVLTKQSGDLGVDVELRAPDGELGVAQCKHSPTAKIGRKVVQELYGEMTSRRAGFAYVMTTGTFTDEARAWARAKPIVLVDRALLMEMLGDQVRHRTSPPAPPEPLQGPL